jgi:stonin-1/2
VKGIDRFLGTMDNLEPHLIEVTSGEAKYEHHHRAVVWRMPRLPKEGQGMKLRQCDTQYYYTC